MSNENTESVVSTDAFVGKAFLYVGTGASPPTYVRYCEVYDISELGAKNDQVEATTFCSGDSKEFIPGLSEGQEFTFSGNYSTDNDTQEDLIDSVEDKLTLPFQLQMGASSPPKKFNFKLAMLQWGVTPSLSSKNVVKFVGKITGDITRS